MSPSGTLRITSWLYEIELFFLINPGRMPLNWKNFYTILDLLKDIWERIFFLFWLQNKFFLEKSIGVCNWTVLMSMCSCQLIDIRTLCFYVQQESSFQSNLYTYFICVCLVFPDNLIWASFIDVWVG